MCGQAATSKAKGFKDAYYCKNCKKYFEDATCKKLIGDEAAYNTWKTTGAGAIAKTGSTSTGIGGIVTGITKTVTGILGGLFRW